MKILIFLTQENEKNDTGRIASRLQKGYVGVGYISKVCAIEIIKFNQSTIAHDLKLLRRWVYAYWCEKKVGS
jgi:hypothetical protein